MITRDKLEQRIAALEMAEKRRRDSMTNTATVEEFIAPCYLPLHEDIKAGRHRFYNLPGGRGSCKSSFVSLEIVDGIQSDPTGQSNAIVFRKVAYSFFGSDGSDSTPVLNWQQQPKPMLSPSPTYS